ncbi:MAG: tetratricopeptide repeat protein [Pseudomonadota bacterium]
MSDVFREVEEDLRTEKLKSLAKRWGPFVAIAIILAIGGVAGYTYYEEQQVEARQAASESFADALAQARTGEADAALTLLDEEAREGDGGFQILAAFAAAEVRSENGEVPTAIDGWRALADNTAAGQPLRDVARLLAVMHAMDEGEAADLLEGELAPLAESSRPLSYLARELTALLALRQGELDRARSILTELSDDPESPVGLRGRATQLLDSLGS